MRKFLCIAIVFMICFFSVYSYADDNNTSLSETQSELKEKIENSNENLSSVQNELSENLQQVQKIDEKIETIQTEVNEMNTKIENLQTSINEMQSELNDIEKKYNTQKELLDERLIAIYEAGDTQYLDVVLSSKDISDFLSNYFLITEIAQYDSDLLSDVSEKKDNIDAKLDKLENQSKELENIRQSEFKTATVLENTKALRQNYVAKLSDQEKEIQSKIDEYTARYNEINAQILALSKEGSINSEYIGGEMAWPVPGYTTITSEYGMRTHPITGVYKLHTGVDISAPIGATFVAANDGIVTKAEYNSAYGNMVLIDHGGGISTLYAHGSEILVTVGQTVKRGDSVLKVGSTGYSTGPHAHFEVRINGSTTNPLPYITNGLVPSENGEEN